MRHKYELEKYKGMRSRHECPACHHKGVFARYVDTATGGYLSPDVGRCNREDKCGYHYTPKQYCEDYPDVTQRDRTVCTSRLRQGIRGRLNPKGETAQNAEFADAIKKERNSDAMIFWGSNTGVPEPRRIPKQYVIRSLGYGSSFVRFLLTLFDRDTLESPTVVRLMGEYYLGCTKDGAVIYWQIDAQNRVRTGKIMRYDSDSGKRIKTTGGAIDWVHAKLKRSGALPDDWELSQCLFGEHRLRRRPSATVCLVESEKSAVIGSGVMPEYVWLATGGKQNLKAEKCECLNGRNVILFPDLGAFDEWTQKGREIARRVGFSLMVSDTLERIATPEDRANGLDIADYLIRQIKAGNGLRTAITSAENELKTSVEPLTGEEQALRHMAAKNPEILHLIASIDLVSASTGRRLRTRIN